MSGLCDKALHVAHVVLSLDVGGLERIVLDLAREGAKLGQRVSIICLERPGALAAQAEALGATVRCALKPSGLHPRSIGRISGVLKELAPDVVHTHQVGALFYTGPAAWAGGARTIVHTEHGKHYASRWRTRVLGRLGSQFASRFFCVSQDIANEVVCHRVAPLHRVRVIANGIDVQRFSSPVDSAEVRQSLGIPIHAPVVGTIGRLSEIKRQDLLIQGFARARKHVPGAHLLLVGDGPAMPGLRELTGWLGVTDFVHFAGYQAQPELFLHAMDLFALTSRSEGMPLAILEAWAAGVPVIGSDIPALAELIRDGQDGCLFPSGNVDALAARIRDLLRQPTFAGHLSAGGNARVRSRFDIRQTAGAYHQNYLSLLGRTAAAA